MIVALDPGPTPGFATYDEERERHEAWIEPSWYAGADRIWLMFQRSPLPTAFVCESFVIRGAREKSSNETIEMIGVARWFCMDHGMTLVEQTPADMMSFVTPDKLKAIGWWTPGKEDHARSASSHLLLYLVRAKLLDARRLLTSESTSTEEE